MKNPFTNTSSNLSNIFHNNIHRKKGESLKVRSTKKFFPGSAAGAAALNKHLQNKSTCAPCSFTHKNTRSISISSEIGVFERIPLKHNSLGWCRGNRQENKDVTPPKKKQQHPVIKPSRSIKHGWKINQQSMTFSPAINLHL